MSTKSVWLTATLLLASCGGGGGGSPAIAIAPTVQAAPVSAPAPAEPAATIVHDSCHVVIYGDSIITGTPSLTETVPQALARLRPTWTVDNRAVGGQTAAQGATAHMGDLLPQGTKVVVEWGMNDLLDQTEFAIEVDAFVKAMIAQKTTAVITGIIEHPASGVTWDYYNTELRTIATSDGTAFVSWGEVPITTVDGIHPNQASSDALVEDLINTLDKECDVQ